MTNYIVRITETLARNITVQADSEESAIATVRAHYDNEDIVLDSSDYICTSFTARKAEE